MLGEVMVVYQQVSRVQRRRPARRDTEIEKMDGLIERLVAHVMQSLMRRERAEVYLGSL